MATRPLPDAATLHKLLRYEAETGRLYWRPRPVDMFKADRMLSADGRRRQWNTRYAGKEAFSAKNRNGYLHGSLGDVYFLAHRVIWLMVTGDEPCQIDHINHDRTDNRIANLRSCSVATNNRNMALSSRNKSGVSGVEWIARDNRWRASIRGNRKSLHLGNFKSFTDAVSARKAAERLYDYHPNHGKAKP